MTTNTVDIAPLIFAALYLGATITATPVFSSILEYESFLGITKPKYVICDFELYRLSKQCLKSQNIDATILTFNDQTIESISVNILFANPDPTTRIE